MQRAAATDVALQPLADPAIPLPKGWPAWTQRAFIHAVALTRMALYAVQGWAANSPLLRARLQGELSEARGRLAAAEQEARILQSRLASMDARKRPHYPPTSRMAILALRAAQGWSLADTARRFFVTEQTIASWMARLDEAGVAPLVQMPGPVNKYPDFVAALAHEVKRALPCAGKKRIAQMLARGGLHLAANTIRRMLERKAAQQPPPTTPAVAPGQPTAEAPMGAAPAPLGSAPPATAPAAPARRVTSKRPHHLWNIDLTLLPTTPGWWVPWLPFALLQRWPFCFWLGVVFDHFSRSVVAWKLYRAQPGAADVCRLLEQAKLAAGRAPSHLITDQGPQFRDDYRAWCARRRVKPRYGAVQKHGSISVIERFFGSLKAELFGPSRPTPFGEAKATADLGAYVVWYHEHRPHQGLGGRTPAEVLTGRKPARDKQRFEPRPHYPIAQASSARAARRPRRGLVLVTTLVEHHAHLPIVTLRDAA